VGGSEKSTERAKKLNLANEYFAFDATDAVGLYNRVSELTGGKLADVVINCVNIENTEMASILACKDRGTVYFFSMATSFTKAALGAEGVGKDVDMIIGNGYCKDHAETALEVLRENEGLRKLFEKMYA
jgi:L-erythro-3,5-diaminohexanoate dehydrogenase